MGGKKGEKPAKSRKAANGGGAAASRGGTAEVGPGSQRHCFHCDEEQGLAQHSAFFDALVDLIPAKFYLAGEKSAITPVKFLKKSARADAKAQFKVPTRRPRRTSPRNAPVPSSSALFTPQRRPRAPSPRGPGTGRAAGRGLGNLCRRLLPPPRRHPRPPVRPHARKAPGCVHTL